MSRYVWEHKFVDMRQNDPVESHALGKLLMDGWVIYSASYHSKGRMSLDICRQVPR